VDNGLRSSFELMHELPYGLVVRWRGSIAMTDLVRSTRAVSADPSFEDLLYKIYDCRNATGRHEPREEAALEDVAAQIIGESVTNPRVLRAWVGTDPVLRGMFSELGSVAQLRFDRFDDLASARRWARELIMKSTGMRMKIPR
jgi:hypothetical protein